jgi:DNA transformation protein and related proteins
MALSDDFLNYVLDQFAHWGAVTVRRMFGGAGLYREGRMFGLIADDVVYLKVDDLSRANFIKAGSAPFNPYPEQNRATVLSYYELPPEVLENRDLLAQWAQRSFEIQAHPRMRAANKSKHRQRNTAMPQTSSTAPPTGRRRGVRRGG